MYGVFRHERHGLADEEARRRMRLLVPDIRRAVLIAKVIDLKQAEAAMLAQTLDGLRTAMMHNQRGMANSRITSMALARWRMTARVAVARNEDHTIDAHERPLQSQGILVVRNAQGDSRMAGACLRFAHPDHCDHVVAE